MGYSEYILLIGAVIILAGILAGKIGYKLGIPSLLLFLFTGMFFGSSGWGIDFENAEIAQFVGIIALSIILFSGGMDTKMRDIKPIVLQGVVLSTFGVLLTTVLVGVFIWWLSGFSWSPVTLSLPIALLLAAVMSSTDSASVFAILRSQKMQLKENLKPTLELESGSNDPMAFMLTIALIQYINVGDANIGNIIGNLLLQLGIGVGLGLIFGRLAVWALNNINIENDTLYPIVLLCCVFIGFSVTNMAMGNGYLAVYLMGIVVGNSKVVHKKSIGTIFDGMTWLVQICLFILLGLLVNPNELIAIAPFAIIIAVFMILLGRPLSVFISLLPFRNYSFRGRLYLSWVGLRGAVPIIFATYPLVANVPEAQLIFNVVFFVTILSLLIQGGTVSYVAKLLHLDIPAPAEGNLFGVEIPEETGTTMHELEVTAEMLANGNRLMDIDLKDEELVILVNTGTSYRVPKGPMVLNVGYILLIVSETSEEARKLHNTNSIERRRYRTKRIWHHISRARLKRRKSIDRERVKLKKEEESLSEK